MFQIVSAKNSKWNMSAGDNTKTLYSSKITVKPKATGVLPEDVMQWFDKLDRHYSKPVVKPHSTTYGQGDKLLIIPISDLHYNLQSTMFCTGNEYNCEIAEKLFFDTINDILSRTRNYKFDKIIFTIGGDMMNADSPANTTYKGTPQDCDKHYLDACELLYAMTVKAIDIIADIAPVNVIYIPSNHDLNTGYQLAKYVNAWFRNDDRVSVDFSPLFRKYIKFGKTLFAFMHTGDVKKLRSLIPDEARAYWSDVDFTEVFLQHLHREQELGEKDNMRIQRLPTICAKSKWTHEEGYNSRRQCKSFVYDKDDGLMDVIYSIAK